VFVASPSDVGDERQRLGAVASRINRIAARDWGWEIDLRGWEDTLPGYARPQSLINPDVDECDIFIGILWKRWGQSTGTFSSGFEEEFERAVERRSRLGNPEIWLYFREVDRESRSDPGPQLTRVLEFQREVSASKSLLYRTYASAETWEVEVFEHLMRVLGQRAVLGGTEGHDVQSKDRERLLESTVRPPEATSLLKLVGDPHITGTRIFDRWNQSLRENVYSLLPSALGADGLWAVDPFDSSRGTTTLLVGTTGSGKSEAFISIVASAALSISPRLLRVTALDMKSNSYIRLLAALGLADADERRSASDQIESLIGEVQARESLIGNSGCRDFREFWNRFPDRREDLPFRLVCVDEVSGLIRPHEELLKRLLETAAHARAAGMHFMLGAQRMAGVGGSVRGLCERRVCFRVEDHAESLDAVGTPDATLIPRTAPGSAIVRDRLDEPKLVRFGHLTASDEATLTSALKEAVALARR
jgi:hypothetical protein